MPNYKIFQDYPDQARVKIFGGNNVALNTDSQGNLTITSTGLAITPPAGGLSITPPTNGLTITSTGLAITAPSNGLTVTAPASGLSITPPTGGLSITPPTNGLIITSTGLAITAPSNGLTVTAPASGLSITPPTGGLLVTGTVLQGGVSTTDVSAVRANIIDTVGSPDTTYTVLGVQTWTLGVVNAALAVNAQALVKLQTSPDGSTWIDEGGGSVTINRNSASTFVAATMLKYARLYYSAVNASSAVTLNIFFQGQL